MEIQNLYNFILKYYGSISSIFPWGYALAPVHIYYTVTFGCNLNCSFCMSKDFMKAQAEDKISNSDSILFFKSTIRQLPKFSLLSLTGGEPLLSPNFLDIANIAAVSHRTSLSTNGTLITGLIARGIIRLGALSLISKGLIAIDISFHGDRRIHNLLVGNNSAYDLAIEGIKKVIYYKKKENKRYPLVNLRCVITEHNYTILEDMLETGKELGVDIYTFSLIHCMGKQYVNKDFAGNIDLAVLKDQLDRVFKKAREYKLAIWFSPAGLPISEIIKYYSKKVELGQYRCFFPWSRAVVSYRGDCSVCQKYFVGNLKNQRFSDLWNNKKSRKFRLLLKKGGLSEDCLGCCGTTFIRKK